MKPKDQKNHNKSQNDSSSISSSKDGGLNLPIVLKPSNFDEALPILRAPIKHIRTKRGNFKIVIRKVEKPLNQDFEHKIAWICSSLGFFEPIDKQKNAAAIFKALVIATERGEALSSTALAERIGMSRGSTINHLNKLLSSGLIEKHGRYYFARSSSMQQTIEEIEEDINRIFVQMKKVAREIDKELGILVE